MPWLSAFLAQPIEVVLYQLTVLFGWIGTAAVLFWGFAQMWLNHRQGIFAASLQHVLLAINVPATTEQTPKAIETLFANLIGCQSNFIWKDKWLSGKLQPVFGFEIASSEGYVQFYVWTQTKYRDIIEAGIYAHYPEAEISEVEDYASFAPSRFPDEHHEGWGMEMTLDKDEHLPIRTFMDFEDKIAGELRDPLGQILEQFAKMRPGEHFWMQVLLSPKGNEWQKAGMKHINKMFGKEEKHAPGMFASGISAAMSIPNALLQEAVGISLMPGEDHKEEDQWKAFKITPIEKEQGEGVLRKIGKVGFPCKVRLLYLARKEAFNKGARAPMIKGLLLPYAHLNMNKFTGYGPSIPKDDYFWQRWSYAGKQGRLFRAYRKRSFSIGGTPRVLNAEELATLWHFPAIGVKAPFIQKAEARRGEPPVGLPIDLEGAGLAPLPARVPQEGHATTHGEPAPHEAAAADAHAALPGLPELETPQVSVPAMPIIAGAAVAPPARTDASEEPEARELGLDATDMGPPADVELPGPPPGWREGAEGAGGGEKAERDEKGEEAPPNLPV